VSALQQMAITPLRVEICGDDAAALQRLLATAVAESDLVIITGGVSVGDHDFTRAALAANGVEEWFWRVAQKPGKPVYMGAKVAGAKATAVLGLPGNPYAVFSCFQLYGRRVLAALMGCDRLCLRRGRLPLAKPLPKKSDRDQFLKGRTVADATTAMSVEVLTGQGSHLLRSLSVADVLIHQPAGRVYDSGEVIDVIWLP